MITSELLPGPFNAHISLLGFTKTISLKWPMEIIMGVEFIDDKPVHLSWKLTSKNDHDLYYGLDWDNSEIKIEREL